MFANQDLMFKKGRTYDYFDKKPAKQTAHRIRNSGLSQCEPERINQRTVKTAITSAEASQPQS
jgi:hypothetical protein